MNHVAKVLEDGLSPDALRARVLHAREESAGLQAGISQDDVLIVFRDAKTLKTFLDKGWEVGAGAAASTGAKDKSAGGGAGEIPGANYYTLTKNGLTIGGNVTGNKFWKEKDLN